LIKRSSVQVHLLINKSNVYLQELPLVEYIFWSTDPLFKNMFDKQIKVLSTCFNQSKCFGQSTRLKYIWWSSNPVFNYNCWLTNQVFKYMVWSLHPLFNCMLWSSNPMSNYCLINKSNIWLHVSSNNQIFKYMCWSRMQCFRKFLINQTSV